MSPSTAIWVGVVSSLVAALFSCFIGVVAYLIKRMVGDLSETVDEAVDLAQSTKDNLASYKVLVAEKYATKAEVREIDTKTDGLVGKEELERLATRMETAFAEVRKDLKDLLKCLPPREKQ